MATATEIFLTSETFIKSVLAISDNTAGKYMRAAMREAQEIALKAVIGPALLNKIKTLIAAGTISASDNAAYKALVDEAQYFLSYQTGVELIPKVSMKIANIGLNRTSDDNIQSATADDMEKTQYYYETKAEWYRIELQQYVIDNKASLPELTEDMCDRIHANLHSAAAGGLWLGGPRGKGPYVEIKRRRRS